MSIARKIFATLFVAATFAAGLYIVVTVSEYIHIDYMPLPVENDVAVAGLVVFLCALGALGTLDFEKKPARTRKPR